MASFKIDKQNLMYFVQTYQQNNPDHIPSLQKQGENLDRLLQALATDPKFGISKTPEALKARKDCFGSNQKQPKKPPSLFALFCEALEDFILRILILSAFVSIGLQVGLAEPQNRKSAWIQGFAILVAVAVCASVAAGNNYQKQKQFIELNSVADEKKKVTVVRGGQILEIHQDFVLVGDIVSIVEGMQIPADGLVIEAADITIDESSMTGQTNPIVKNTLLGLRRNASSIASDKGQKHFSASPVMMGGTRVLTGEGKMLVIVVGDQSCMGKIRAMLEQEDQTKTPLEQKLQTLADNIGKFALASAIAIMLVLFIRFGIFKIQKPSWDTKTDLQKMLGYIIIGITVIVVAIPEGLPLSVTLSLAFSVKKMLKDQNLVRRMEACETMGGANNICSDKTGTLTMNKMILTEIWNGKVIKIDTYADKLETKSLQSCNQFIEHFKVGCLVNSTAMLVPEEKGSSTEIAFLKYFDKMGIQYQQVREQYPTTDKFPFSSSRKRMSVVLQNQGEYYLYTKGASEIILKSCTHWISGDSVKQQKLNNQVRSHIEEVITNMATKSLRTLCVAYKKIPNTECYGSKDKRGIYPIQDSNLTLVAVIGVRDNPRKEVPDAIKKCHRAGITVRMVTGDNLVTARAIAKEIGLIKDDGKQSAMQGPQFNKIVGGIVCKKCDAAVCDCPITAKQAEEQKRDIRVDTVKNGKEFDKLIDKLFVLARSRPEDKYCLVTGLKERGHVVAVTGDGTNDAPALKKADVGFAMGIAGTEVAREAAAIILVDDNFNSIVKAVLWGRNIYDSIRKFLQFQLTINVVAVFVTLLGSALLQKEVLRPIQMLWINLIMDSIASLALSTESPHESLLLRLPYKRDANIISQLMKKNIIGHSIYQVLIMAGMIFFGERFIPEYNDSLDNDPLYIANPQFKWYNGVIGGTVCSGRFYTITGDNDYYPAFEATKNYSRHYTFIFNTFVMLQIFNFINSRKIHGEINVFSGMLKHRLFIILVFFILVIQILIITFAGFGFGLYPNGLSIQQWGISFGIGSTSLLVGLLLKFIPYGDQQQLQSLGDNANYLQKGGKQDADVYRRLKEDS